MHDCFQSLSTTVVHVLSSFKFKYIAELAIKCVTKIFVFILYKP